MKIKDLRELSTKELEGKITKELEGKIRESKKELFGLRMKQSTGTLDKPSRIKELRKDVARMKTILKEREFAGGNTDGE